MPIPVQFNGRLSIPAVAAPMFLVSNPDLVVECCRAGIVGTFPALNNRTSESYEAWLIEIRITLYKRFNKGSSTIRVRKLERYSGCARSANTFMRFIACMNYPS